MGSKNPSLTATWHNNTYPAIDPTQSHLSLKGKSVLITGGGRGIGARTARSFAAAGASIISITGRTLSTLESTKAALESEYPKTMVLVAPGDVTDEKAMEAAFAALSKANNGHGVDICIHNAGYLPDANTIATADKEDWWSGFTTQLLGSFVVTRAFLKHKNESASPEPILVDLGTAAIIFPPPPGFSGYTVSKFAQSRFFEAVAAEEPGIRVMQIHPGVIATDMGNKSIEAGLVLPLDDSRFTFSLKKRAKLMLTHSFASSLPPSRLPSLGSQRRCGVLEGKIHLL
jgi:NAD(P)-dependent dehydrogenase (short-subunit alcohol dehydrogenase family)